MDAQHPAQEKSAPDFRPDDLTDRLLRTINSRTGGHVRDLRVDITESGVILTGKATTYYAKQLATHAAFDELNGEHVENAIDVC